VLFTGTEVDDYPGLHEFLATKYSPLQDVNKIDAILNDEQLIKKLGMLSPSDSGLISIIVCIECSAGENLKY